MDGPYHEIQQGFIAFVQKGSLYFLSREKRLWLVSEKGQVLILRYISHLF